MGALRPRFFTMNSRKKYYAALGVANAQQALALRRSQEAAELSKKVLALTKWKQLSLRTIHMVSDEAQKHLFELWMKENRMVEPEALLIAKEVYNDAR